MTCSDILRSVLIATTTPFMNSLYVTTGRGQGTSFDVPSLCFLFTEDKGNDGSVFEDSIRTGARFFFSCQITANIEPFSDCSCHCFDSG